MSYTAEPKQQDTNIKIPLISKIAFTAWAMWAATSAGCSLATS